MNLLFVLFVLFGIVAMIDFWRWEYNYGHNLDPECRHRGSRHGLSAPIDRVQTITQFWCLFHS